MYNEYEIDEVEVINLEVMSSLEKVEIIEGVLDSILGFSAEISLRVYSARELIDLDLEAKEYSAPGVTRALAMVSGLLGTLETAHSLLKGLEKWDPSN